MRSGLAVLLLVGLLAWLTPADAPRAFGQDGDTPEPEPTSRPRKYTSTSPVPIERLAKHLLATFSRNLTNKDWITRAMCVISLARLDDPRATDMIMEVMQKDENVAVRVYAWEALHGRLDLLTPDQFSEWIKAGKDLANRNALRGDLRLALIGVLEAGGPTAENKRVFQQIFLTTNSLCAGDVRTIWALGDLLGKWHSPDLARGMIAGMGKLDMAYRCEMVMGRLDKSIPRSATLRKDGSDEMWQQTAKAWGDWFDKQQWQELDGNKPGACSYTERSALYPPCQKITDAGDMSWRKDMELGKFHLDQLDVGFVVDSTGSMGQVLIWIQRDVVKMMTAFELVSREPRISVVLYRDFGDEYLVKPIPLQKSAKELAEALRGAKAKGGGDIPEAILEGLTASLRGQNWSSQASARKVVVLMGDAPPHEDSLEKIDKLVKEFVDRNFVIYAIKVKTLYSLTTQLPDYDPKLQTFDHIAEVGKGKSFWVDFTFAEQNARDIDVANPPNVDAPEQVILREVLKAAIMDDYKDRVDTFINVLMQYVDQPLEEKRQPFGPSHGGGGGGKPPPPPPDPQKQR